MFLRYIGFVFFFLSVFSQIKSQQKDMIVFRNYEDSCIRYFKELRIADNDDEKVAVNAKITCLFKQMLPVNGSFDYPFDSLHNVGRLYAPDKSFRIITWNIVFNNGDYKCFGFIQMSAAPTGAGKVFELIDRTEEVPNLENSVLSSGKWLGALYYKIFQNKIDNRTYYTLLALQYHNVLITRKILEILYFDEWKNPVFGAPIIQLDQKVKHRLVLEYSAMSSVNLKYDGKMKMIIFDHLAPIEPKYTGMYQYYGPDLTFDGLQFKKGKWQYIPNLDLRRPSDPRYKKRQLH
jgi:hypothetical protein